MGIFIAEIHECSELKTAFISRIHFLHSFMPGFVRAFYLHSTFIFAFIAFIHKLHSFAFTHSFIYCSPGFIHAINATRCCVAFMYDANTYISRVA